MALTEIHLKICRFHGCRPVLQFTARYVLCLHLSKIIKIVSFLLKTEVRDTAYK